MNYLSLSNNYFHEPIHHGYHLQRVLSIHIPLDIVILAKDIAILIKELI